MMIMIDPVCSFHRVDIREGYNTRREISSVVVGGDAKMAVVFY
jgi:hypothetical protein